MVPTKVGVTIVGVLGFLLAIALITSLVVYRKWWTGFFRMPRRGHRKLFWADVHRLAGVWSIWFIAVIAITGIWYFAEVWGLRAQYPDRGKALSEQALDAKVLPSVAVFSEMMASAKTLYPELAVERVFFHSEMATVCNCKGRGKHCSLELAPICLALIPYQGHC